MRESGGGAGRSLLTDALHRLARDRAALAGLALLLLGVALAVAAPVVSRYGPVEQRLVEKGSGFRVQGSVKTALATSSSSPEPRTLNPELSPIDLDDAYLTGVLQELVDQSSGNIEQLAATATVGSSVPVINRVSAGYPRDFTDLSYPPRVADEYVSCPGVRDQDAFAARVHGDSMTPKYCEGDIVIFSPAATPKDGDDCFVRFADGHTTFKRVFFEKAEGNKQVLRLQPRNEKYRPQVVASEDVSGLYKALYRYQRVDE